MNSKMQRLKKRPEYNIKTRDFLFHKFSKSNFWSLHLSYSVNSYMNVVLISFLFSLLIGL